MLCLRVSTVQTPGKVITHLIVPVVLLPPPYEVSIFVYKLKVAPGQVDTLDIEKEKEIIGEQEIVYDEFVEEADMEDVENEDDDAAEELFDLSQLDKSLTPNRMKRTLNDGAKPIVWRVQTPPKDAWLNSSLSDNEFKEFIALCNRKGDSFLSNRNRLSSAPNLLEGKHFLIAGKNKMIKIGDIRN